MRRVLFFMIVVVCATLSFAKFNATGFKKIKTKGIPYKGMMVTSQLIKGLTQQRGYVAPKPDNTSLTSKINTVSTGSSNSKGRSSKNNKKGSKKNKGSLTGFDRNFKIPTFTPPALLNGWTVEKEYAKAKPKIEAGEYDTIPSKLLLWACYADAHGDEEFALETYSKAKSQWLTPDHVYILCNAPEGLENKRVDLVQYCAEFEYQKNESNIFYDDSIANRYKDILTLYAKQYLPGILPLINIAYHRVNGSDVMDDYRMITDSIISGAYEPNPDLKGYIIYQYLSRLFDAEKYGDMMTLASLESIAPLMEDAAEPLWLLCNAALMAEDKEKLDYYLECLAKKDEDLAIDYANQIYDIYYNHFIENPDDLDLAEWLVSAADHPAEKALSLFCDLIAKCNEADSDDNSNWRWVDASELTPEQADVVMKALHIGSFGLEEDKQRSSKYVTGNLGVLLANYYALIPGQVENVDKYIDEIEKDIENEPDPIYNDLRMRILLTRAYFAGHGLDKPREAYKILKKEIKKVPFMGLSLETGIDYWEYLRDVCEAMGKKKDAEKYNATVELLKKQPDAKNNENPEADNNENQEI